MENEDLVILTEKEQEELLLDIEINPASLYAISDLQKAEYKKNIYGDWLDKFEFLY